MGLFDFIKKDKKDKKDKDKKDKKDNDIYIIDNFHLVVINDNFSRCTLRYCNITIYKWNVWLSFIIWKCDKIHAYVMKDFIFIRDFFDIESIEF